MSLIDLETPMADWRPSSLQKIMCRFWNTVKKSWRTLKLKAPKIVCEAGEQQRAIWCYNSIDNHQLSLWNTANSSRYQQPLVKRNPRLPISPWERILKISPRSPTWSQWVVGHINLTFQFALCESRTGFCQLLHPRICRCSWTSISLFHVTISRSFAPSTLYTLPSNFELLTVLCELQRQSNLF